jgi:DNA-binding helix-hairpin-helix protein with protein kinase domain/Tfp pilus assembly protein PilF
MKKISQAEEVHALHSPKSRLQKFPEASWAFLIYVAANIARAVAAIHEHGLVIGDVNPKNILVTRKATVYLLDVDSFQVSAEGKTYRCEGGFPEYTPPELQGVAFRDVDRAQDHDCFGLAVVIFQLLFMGRHPFSGRYLGAGEMPLERAIREYRFAYGVDAEARKMRQPPGTLALDSMPSLFVRLFRRAFLTTDRPRPREWIEPLDALAKALKKCDLHSGHYYFRELRDCPWCGIETHARVRLFNFLLPGDDSRRGYFRLDEVWKEIESVKKPNAPMIRWDNKFEAPEPSAEVSAFASSRRSRFIFSLIFSFFAGLAIPFLISFPAAFFLLVLAGIAACAISNTGRNPTVQLLLHQRQPVPDDPLLDKVRARWRKAKEAAHLLKEQYDREAGNERWGVKRNDLRNQKETYENLAQIRQFRLQQLEDEARKNQLDEFLDQFEIDEAEIKGIGPSLKTVLLSHGIETAADVSEIEKMGHIPSIGSWRAKWLLEWRRDLEQKFVFDAARGVQPEVRIKTEREVDTLKFRLESELSGGAHYLRRMKEEIEASRKKLQPVLTQAREELAQAEKDLEVARERNSPALILAVLIIAFFIGWANVKPQPARGNQGQFPAASKPDHDALADQRMTQEAVKFYREGERLSKKGKFSEAVEEFQKAIENDPKLDGAYEKLGHALYRLNRYEESAEAWRNAIYLHPNFKTYYNLGLVHIATENWQGAAVAFQQGIELREPSSWQDEYTEAYYYLGLSLAKAGDVQKAIQDLEADAGFLDGVPINRFKLATLYLCAGQGEAAKEQYRLLKKSDPALAQELWKLMKKYGKSA